MEKFYHEPRLIPVDFDPFGGPAIARTIPTTEAQREVFVACRMGPEASCAYNESVSLELTGAMDQAALERAIGEVIRRHEALRSTISGDGLRMLVQEQMPIAVAFSDLAHLGASARNSALETAAASDMGSAFDLLHGPLFRVQLWRINANTHLLRLTGHHIVCDGWSLGIIMADLGALYSGRPLPAAIPFSEYVLALIDDARSDDHERVERFWLAQFKGRLPRLDIPTDHPRPMLKTWTGARIDIPLKEELTRKLKEVATRSGASLVTTLLACYELLLYHISGESDMVVGLPAAGQNDFGMKQLVGHCVNLLALRSRIDEDRPFIEHLKERRGAVLDATDHQRYAFGTLVRKLNVPREPGRIPLVPAVFNVDMNMDDGVAFNGLTHRFISNPRRFENFELFLNATGTDKEVTLEWSYNSDLFNESTVRGWMDEMQGIIERAHAAPTQRIATLLSPPRRDASAPLPPALWSGTPSSYPREAMDVLFDRMCDRYPDRTAVEVGDERITYAELRRSSDALAAELLRRGLKTGENVGLCLDRCIGTQTAMLAILKAGGCYVPFDLSYPAERVRYMLEDAQVRFMLTHEHLLPQLPGCENKAILLDATGRSAGTPFPERMERRHEHGPDSAAYIMYTSGSTGKPKGVIVPHRGVVRLVREQNYMNYEADLAFLQMGNLCFDASTFEIWGALLNGARLVLQPQTKATLGEIAETIARHHVTSVLFPTGLFNMMVDEHLGDLGSLKHILSGGDVMSPAHARKVLQALGPGVLVNAYGPTENSVIVTCHAVDHEEQLTGTVPIGKPISNTTAYILDETMRPVPIGSTGELYAGGDGVALGYWRRPELTADRFVPDPFNGTPDAMLYRTGDLARWRSDGTIEFIGRADTQVKLRGFRIELGEIEAAIDTLGAVKDRVVVCRTEDPGGKRIVAYVVPKDAAASTDITAEDALTMRLRDHLSTQLPAHMLPSAFVVMDEFPLNRSGKVDRKALPPPTLRTPTLRAKHVAPRDPVETDLARIWSNVLRVPDVGVHDNFFDLGGHSLTGIELLAAVEQRFDRALPLKDLFVAPTISEMAGLLQAGAAHKKWSNLRDIQPNGTRAPLFCVHGDDANYFLPKYLGNDQPFYGIFHQGDDGGRIRHTTVEDMAAHFLSEIRSVRPHGPYLLCGYSFGGIVAYEMAQQLLAAGEEVPVLAMFDTYDPSEYRKVMKRELRFYHPWKEGVMLRIADRMLDRGGVLPGRIRHSYIIGTYNKAIAGYEVRPYNGRITLLRTSDDTGPRDMGWASLARGGVDIREVPGDHYNMVKEPYVADLAATLAQVIDERLRASKAGAL